MVKQQLHRPLLELAYRVMGKTAEVKSFMKEFIDVVLCQYEPLAQQIRKGAGALPGYKPVKVGEHSSGYGG